MFVDATQRRIAISVWVTSFSAGAALGPLLGGLLLSRFWWGSVFLLAVPVMVMLVVVGPALLPEFRDPSAGRLDLFSAALSLASTLSVIYGLKQIAQDGVGWAPVLSTLTGLVVGLVFVRRQQVKADPMVDLRLFRNRAFSAALAINTLDFFVGFGIILFISQYLQLVFGLSPLDAGLWMVPWALGFIAGSLLTPVLVRHARPAFVMAAGLVFAALGFVLLTQAGTASLAVFVVGSVVFSVGLAPMTTLATDIMIGTAPPERAGAAAAISETSSELGGALGIAVLGSVGTAVYRRHLAHLPSDVPSDAAAIARDMRFDRSLGGRINLLLPAHSKDSERLRQMLVAFDPDIVISDVAVPSVVARLRLPTVSFTEARAWAFPLALVSDLHEHFNADGVLFVGDELAPRHVRLNLGCLKADDLKSLREHIEGTALVTVLDASKILETSPRQRWSRIAGPLGLYGWTQTIGDPDSGTGQLPQEGRTVIVSAPDDLDAICFFWNLRAFHPDLDALWLPRPELTEPLLSATTSWIWFDSGGDIPITTRGARRPDGYIYRRYGNGIWTNYSIEQAAVATARSFAVTHPTDRKPNLYGLDLALCLEVDGFPDFAGPVSVSAGRLFLGDASDQIGTDHYIRSGGGTLVTAVKQLKPGRNHPLSLEFRRPSGAELIGAVAAEREITIRTTRKSKLISELIALLGRLDDAALLRDRRIVDQFVAMAPRRAERIAKALRIANVPDKQVDELQRVLFRDVATTIELAGSALPWPVDRVIKQLGNDSAGLVDQLCAQRLLLPGKAFACVHCEAQLWFPLSALGSATRCYCCNRDIRVPVVVSGAPLGDALRLNELVANAVDQGSFPTLLLAHVIHEQHFVARRFVFDADIVDQRSGTQIAEVDLMFTIGHLLGVAEAKAERSFGAAQTERLLAAAERLEADLVVCATFLPSTHDDLRSFESTIAACNPRVPVVLVTSEDIFRPKTFDLGALVREPRPVGLVRASSLPDLAPWPAWARRSEARYEFDDK